MFTWSRFRVRLWLIWKLWFNWLPFRLWRGWRNRNEKAVISGFAGIATPCDVRPKDAPDGTFRWLPDRHIGVADVYEDNWPYR